MADLGLLQGLAEGLNSGIDSYYRAQDRSRQQLEDNETRALRKKQYALDLLKSGYEEAPDGLFRISPITLEREHAKKVEDQRAKKAERLENENKEFRLKGFLPQRDASGGIQSVQPLPGFLDPAAARQNRLSPDNILKVSEGNQIPKTLEDLVPTIQANKDYFGPVGGRLKAFDPYDEKAQAINAQLRTAAQSVGRFLEGGVLRKEDEAKYERMLPQLGDTPENAANKLALVKRLVIAKQNEQLQSLKGAGYDTSSVDRGLTLPDTPGILGGGKGGGLLKDANAGGMPKPGMVQDGYRFKGGDPADPNAWEKI